MPGRIQPDAVVTPLLKETVCFNGEEVVALRILLACCSVQSERAKASIESLEEGVGSAIVVWSVASMPTVIREGLAQTVTSSKSVSSQICSRSASWIARRAQFSSAIGVVVMNVIVVLTRLCPVKGASATWGGV